MLLQNLSCVKLLVYRRLSLSWPRHSVLTRSANYCLRRLSPSSTSTKRQNGLTCMVANKFKTFRSFRFYRSVSNQDFNYRTVGYLRRGETFSAGATADWPRIIPGAPLNNNTAFPSLPTAYLTMSDTTCDTSGQESKYAVRTKECSGPISARLWVGQVPGGGRERAGIGNLGSLW
jgi:hypothetical protein